MSRRAGRRTACSCRAVFGLTSTSRPLEQLDMRILERARLHQPVVLGERVPVQLLERDVRVGGHRRKGHR
jgi:hypothetical protein